MVSMPFAKDQAITEDFGYIESARQFYPFYGSSSLSSVLDPLMAGPNSVPCQNADSNSQYS
jgi:hypothetical protein